MDASATVAIIGLIEAIGVVIIGGLISGYQKKVDRQAAIDKEKLEEKVKNEKEQAKLIANMAEGVRTLLRNELVSAHREWVEEKGYITLEALEYMKRTFESYHALKGNGSGDKLWKDLKALPVKD